MCIKKHLLLFFGLFMWASALLAQAPNEALLDAIQRNDLSAVKAALESSKTIGSEEVFYALQLERDTIVQLMVETGLLSKEVLDLCLLLAAGIGDVSSFHILYTLGEADTSYLFEDKNVRAWALEKNREDIIWYLNHPDKGRHW